MYCENTDIAPVRTDEAELGDLELSDGTYGVRPYAIDPDAARGCGRSARNFSTAHKPVVVTVHLLDAVDVEITRLLPDDEAGCADAVALISAATKLDCPPAKVPTRTATQPS